MALDRQKQLQQAERLLKQGKVQAAMLELERLSDSAPKDVLTLNRIGDLLAKAGRREEAVRFYLKIAEQLTSSGFVHKAVAIHKKILRLAPNHVGALAQLGDLYYQQRLPGEARTHLLRAADQYLQGRNFGKAREIYERLVAAEPEDPRHRARLAEARAAEGEAPRAGAELLQLADSLFAAGRAPEAEKAYRRAAELLAGRDEPIVGLVRCLGDQGRHDEALAVLDKAERGHSGSALLLGERVLRYEIAGRGRDAIELLKLPHAKHIDDEVFGHIFRHHRDLGGIGALWDRMDPLLERWRQAGDGDRVRTLLVALSEIEPEGHAPALERLYRDHRDRGDEPSTRRLLDRLIRACRAGGRADDAARWQQELRQVAPSAIESQAADEEPAPHEAVPAAEPAAETWSEATQPVEIASGGGLPVEFEAPAVPLNRADEEYVAGRLTQTEILEKYGLREQALQQVREVAGKFPGHVETQEKLVELLRESGTPHALRDALVGLAVARRAAGDVDAAKRACAEARSIAPLARPMAEQLARLGLDDRTRPASQPALAAPAPPEISRPAPAVRRAPAARPATPAVAPEPALTTTSHDGAILIDLDAMDEEESAPEPASVPAAAAGPTPRAALEAEPQVAQVAPAAAPPLSSPIAPGVETPGIEFDADVDAAEDDDLSAITAALEGELFADAAEPVVAEPESEQSLEQVFAAFKEHVEREVGTEDYRTHYDLGIAYKEMGLLEEAIEAFEHAVRSPEIGREAYAMLALCHRERDEMDAAARCYRRAIASVGSDGDARNNLRYELAEVLLHSGDRQGALDEFRDLLDADPSFRDVRDRIAELESRVG